MTLPQDRSTKSPTPYAVACPYHGKVYLTSKGYLEQMAQPNHLWKCSMCNERAHWDDENYDRFGDLYFIVSQSNMPKHRHHDFKWLERNAKYHLTWKDLVKVMPIVDFYLAGELKY